MDVKCEFKKRLPCGSSCQRKISCDVCTLQNDSIWNSHVHAWHENGGKRTCLKGRHSMKDMKG